MENENSQLPHVAVLMATYNGEKYIKQQIDSILGQKNIHVSIFVRDDHSTDQTANIVRDYEAKTGRVFLLDQKSVQLKVTKNFFSIVQDINLVGIDYIAYSDQDDIWLDTKLEKAVSAIAENKVSCYASNLLRGDAQGNMIKPSSIFSKLVQYLLNYKSNNQLQWDHYFEAASAGCSLVLRKEAAIYLQTRLSTIYDRIPENASHDWSTYALSRIGGYQWYIDSNSYIIYRQHSDNAYGTNTGLKGISKLVDLFRSGWYRRHILMIDELYNDTAIHPLFMERIRRYRRDSFLSRIKTAFSISGHRRKPVHRILLFGLVIFGYFK